MGITALDSYGVHKPFHIMNPPLVVRRSRVTGPCYATTNEYLMRERNRFRLGSELSGANRVV